MADGLKLHFDVDGTDFTVAGECSSKVKKTLKQLGFDPELIRRVAIAMYEGEINMVIHANGGTIDVEISPESVVVILKDTGPGIPDLDKAMQEGFSTASNTVRELGFGAGMGLPNMKKYTDKMEVDTVPGVGTTVTLSVIV
ncbi:MAG: ATP-binding protein [Eubacteriales bacterium]|nr:ATP-binding protein [Eubacteriales bacterium]